MKQPLSRRETLRGLSIGVAVTGLGAKAANAESIAVQLSAAAAGNPVGACVLLPQAVAGPYYFDPKLVRSDIAEGSAGAALKLMLRVVDAKGCTPLSNIRVDVWHADARGIYSGYGGQGDTRGTDTKDATYLRGTQITGADGIVTFQTVYPGWYPGRTPHIHIKAFLDNTSLVTGQIYFPDDVSAKIYRERQPYAARPVPDTINARDGIFLSGSRDGGGTVLSVQVSADIITAALLIGVDRSGSAARDAESWGAFFKRLIWW
jgi:protocatechuate 3,4-dioxygenase beta subunit